MGLRLGVVGAGAFARCFIPLFKAHPLVDEVSLAEILPERRREEAARFGIQRTFESIEAMCESDVDAVAIFTQRWMHGSHSIHALRKGKSVYSAVPTAVSLEEIRELVNLVTATQLTYMLGETSYYYPAAIYCRDRFARGGFGRFVFGEGEYYHDMSHGFYEAFQHSGLDVWKSQAGFPPMYYPTHSTSMVLSVTGARMTKVSCLGCKDDHEDGIFRKGANLWDNEFSNETALFRTSDDGMCRINEFRRVGHFGGPSVRLSLFGTQGSFEQQANAEVWVDLNQEMTDLKELLACKRTAAMDARMETLHDGVRVDDGTQKDFFSGYSAVHQVERLPEAFHSLENGHCGSHQFLVDDFVRACASGRLPPNNVWDAARYCVPGLIAHQSALQDGAQLDIPDFGNPPASLRRL